MKPDENTMEKNLLDAIFEKKLIAIIRGIPAKDMLATADALLAGGIDMMEITFDQTSEAGIRETLDSISLVGDALPGKVALGAGTVMTSRQVVDAKNCGATFIISPNVNREVIRLTKDLGMVSMPGALTPTEIADAFDAGADIVKLFPAGLWGSEYLKAVRGPLGHIPMAAVGGVTPENVGDFLKAGAACAGIGSNLVNAKVVREGNFAAITRVAGQFHSAIR